jgi:fructose-1,6-bisphosphatase
LEEKQGGYAIVFDPLDGSSNIEANVSGIGCIAQFCCSMVCSSPVIDLYPFV